MPFQTVVLRVNWATYLMFRNHIHPFPFSVSFLVSIIALQSLRDLIHRDFAIILSLYSLIVCLALSFLCSSLDPRTSLKHKHQMPSSFISVRCTCLRFAAKPQRCTKSDDLPGIQVYIVCRWSLYREKPFMRLCPILQVKSISLRPFSVILRSVMLFDNFVPSKVVLRRRL